MEENLHRGLFSVIPSNLRYDDRVCSSAKLMFGELTALANELGYAYASNGYFAKIYKTSERTITRWLKELEKFDYISITYEDFARGTNRKIYIGNLALGAILRVDKNVTPDKTVKGGRQKCLGGDDKNVNHIKNSLLTKEDNKNIYKNEVVEIIDYLNTKTNSNYKPTSVDSRKHIVARLNEDYLVEDFKKVIDIKASEWLGSDMEKYLRPSTLFGSKFESYLNQKQNKKQGGARYGDGSAYANF